jgi:type IV pilus assembly protein PilW
MFTRKLRIKNSDGLTLIELMVALVISSMVIAAIFMAFNSQHKSYVVQERVAAMQQNLRAGMDMMVRDIRMAGYDPTGDAGAKIIIANIAELQFQIDDNEDGDFTDASGNHDSNEQIRYALTNDDGDGIADGLPCHLGRESWSGGLQTVAENIDALSFIYIGEDGNQLDDGGGNVDATHIDDIRSIQVTLVARTEGRDAEYSNNNTYQIVLPDGVSSRTIYIANDNVRRRMLTTRVRCRNLGL